MRNLHTVSSYSLSLSEITQESIFAIRCFLVCCRIVNCFILSHLSNLIISIGYRRKTKKKEVNYFNLNIKINIQYFHIRFYWKNKKYIYFTVITYKRSRENAKGAFLDSPLTLPKLKKKIYKSKEKKPFIFLNKDSLILRHSKLCWLIKTR